MQVRQLLFLLIGVFIHSQCASGALTSDQVQRVGKVMANACRASSGVKRSLLVRAARGDLEDDRKLKCFFGCILETIRVIQDGKLHPDSLRHKANTMLPTELREMVLPTIEYCGNLENEDKCELAFSLVQCHFEVSGKNPFIFRLRRRQTTTTDSAKEEENFL